MNDDMLSNAWMNNLNSIDLNFAQMSFERAASNNSYSSTSDLLAANYSISIGANATPIKGGGIQSGWGISIGGDSGGGPMTLLDSGFTNSNDSTKSVTIRDLIRHINSRKER